MITTRLLPLRFDPDRLNADLAAIEGSGWHRHFNQRVYDGDWSGLPLRAVAGSPVPMYSDPSKRDHFADTELLQSCPYFKHVLDSLHCPLMAARLLRLTPGSQIKEHRDYDLGFESGDARLHVVVRTNPEVVFVIAGQRVVMNDGECWYADFSQPHSVVNRGHTSRVHLVVDCVINDWLRAFLVGQDA